MRHEKKIRGASVRAGMASLELDGAPTMSRVVETPIGLYHGLERRLYWVKVVDRSKAELLVWAI